MTTKAKVLVLLLIPLSVFVVTACLYYYWISLWAYRGPEVVFTIRPGEGPTSINNRLVERELIASGKIFHRYTRVMGLTRQFKAGDYKIETNSTMLDIIDKLTTGSSITYPVTIPEGKNIFEIGKILGEKSITSPQKFVALARDLTLTRTLGIPGEGMEGYLYPETYRFGRQTGPKKIIQTMFRTFKEKTKDLDFSANPLGLSKHEVIILASIVEKETGVANERATIAGVFVNRLQKKMRLQSDPTTIYGLFEKFDGNLKRKHLRQKTPYNTYRINGLPLGPISNPSMESIMAVISPQKHDYLYFVSRNDGHHIFSKSYREHSKAVNKYQKSGRRRR